MQAFVVVDEEALDELLARADEAPPIRTAEEASALAELFPFTLDAVSSEQFFAQCKRFPMFAATARSEQKATRLARRELAEFLQFHSGKEPRPLLPMDWDPSPVLAHRDRFLSES